MPLYFSYDPDNNGFKIHLTKEAAMEAAHKTFLSEKNYAGSHGWCDGIAELCWGEIKQIAIRTFSGVDDNGREVEEFELKEPKV